MSEKIDKEALALKRCVSAFSSIDEAARSRVMDYLHDRYKTEPLWMRISKDVTDTLNANPGLAEKLREST